MAVRNDSGRAVEIIAIGASAEGISALGVIIQLDSGSHTEITYDVERTNFCWVVVFVEGEARLLKTPLALSHPENCVVEQRATPRPCCTPMPRGEEIVIPRWQDLKPVPSPITPITEAANRARKL